MQLCSKRPGCLPRRSLWRWRRPWRRIWRWSRRCICTTSSTVPEQSTNENMAATSRIRLEGPLQETPHYFPRQRSPESKPRQGNRQTGCTLQLTEPSRGLVERGAKSIAGLLCSKPLFQHGAGLTQSICRFALCFGFK